ncbi:Cold shock-like protein CspD [invertebrate metagenome]|uniref:Cold shock-like protein CspD n=1 Tax=invertebrate metagenome TaxID=1711999 RepID=A0A2H9T9K4_9ZZZZ
MLVGKVKWFNNPKGYGFIEASESTGNQDVLIHYSVIEMEGFKTLKAGQVIRFELGQGPNGLVATRLLPDEGQMAVPEPVETLERTDDVKQKE